MKAVDGKNGLAKVFTNNVDEKALEQIGKMLDSPITAGGQVRIMPDVHYGKGATIGTTIRLPENHKEWKICPNVVGVDIGCSMRTVNIGRQDNLDLAVFDKAVHRLVPAGRAVNQKPRRPQEEIDNLLSGLSFSLTDEQRQRISLSLGSLGGGNHFYELGKDNHDDYWITVHSGSRFLGVLVANHHQKIAQDYLTRYQEEQRRFLIDQLRSSGQDKEIATVLAAFKAGQDHPLLAEVLGQSPLVLPEIEPGLEYLEGDLLDDYLNDIRIAQTFSSWNRKAMLDVVVAEFGFEVKDGFESMHNYVDLDAGIVRKGATSAQAGERLIIPINMKEGSIFATGKGNPDWNFSAPHGAGRLMSRTQAKEAIDLKAFEAEMAGIYTSSVGVSTLDEAPQAYKDMAEIVANIQDTVTIDTIVKPVYNFKAHS